MPQDLPEWFIAKAKAVSAKRAKTVIDHILAHGHITTEELKNLYGRGRGCFRGIPTDLRFVQSRQVMVMRALHELDGET
ncbi:MAG: hypothetical protein ABSG68_20790 [Thermoguttaceae bacterium]